MSSRAPDHDERGTARIAMVAALSVIAAFVAGKAARDAILLSNFAVTTLPLFVGISAVMSLPVVVFAGRIMARIGPARLMPALNVLSAVLLIIEWILLGTHPQIAAIACFLHLGSLGAVLVSGFWSLINERFDIRTAKRHIGRIGLGATLGGILGGLIAERSAVLLPPGAILLVLAGIQLVCAVAMRLLAGPRAGHVEVEMFAPGQTWSALRMATSSALLRNLAFLIVLGAIGAAALDYVFKAEVTAATGAEGPLRFFALFHTMTAVITAIVHVALSRLIVTKLGVARTIGFLPGVMTTFGIGALLVPGLWSAVIARGAEMVTRSSVYRAAYELVYAPLPDADKRSTKVVIDVGAERVGDLVGAQVVGLIIYLVPMPGTWLLACAAIAGAAAMCFALMLPRSYTTALEASLLARAEVEDEASPDASAMWSMHGRSTLAETGDLTTMSLVDLGAAGSHVFRALPAQSGPDAAAVAAMSVSGIGPAQAVERDPLAERIGELRSNDATRVRIALGGKLQPALAAHIVPLIGWDAVASVAIKALRSIAPSCTGVLVDALLDAGQEFTIRRRIPRILEAGEPELARWALWRGMSEPRFEVRYRCSLALARLHAARELPPERFDDVLALVKKELSVSKDVWRSYHLLDGAAGSSPAPDEAEEHDANVLRKILHRKSATGLDHVFTLLALALPPDPVRIAFQGLYTEDRALRATALEYLESVLPPDIRVLLWPFIDTKDAGPVSARPRDEITAALLLSHPTIVANLRQIVGREEPT